MNKENRKTEGNSYMPFISFQSSILLAVLLEMGEGSVQSTLRLPVSYLRV